METTIRRSAISAGNLRILLADSHSVPSHGTSRSARSTVQLDSALSRALTAAALEIYLGRKPSSEELSVEMRIPGEKPWFIIFPTPVESPSAVSQIIRSGSTSRKSPKIRNRSSALRTASFRLKSRNLCRHCRIQMNRRQCAASSADTGLPARAISSLSGVVWQSPLRTSGRISMPV